MERIRAFIALPLADEAKRVLAGVSQALSAQMPPGCARWVRPDRIHLTLRFLGDTAVTLLPDLATNLDRLAQQHPPFDLRLHELGCFPNRKRPRVIWVGLAGDTKTLLSLKSGLDERLVPLGWAREGRPYRAHLTLGRVKDSRRLSRIKWGADVDRFHVPVRELHLIESQLHRAGPIYTTRHRSRLMGKREG